MPLSTNLTERLQLDFPVIQAPMAGGATTVDLVAAVGEAGALGFFGATYMPPDQIVEQARAVRERTNRPFGINLFAPQPSVEAGEDAAAAVARMSLYHAELDLPPPELPTPEPDPFSARFAALLDSGAAIFSFTFGIPPESAIAAAKERGMFVMGTATTVEEAVLLEAAGVDAVVAQGSEAGAHRGTFASPFEAAMIGTMALVPQVVDAVAVPVVASGGIMDGRGVAAALALGAEAVQMGTAFLTCEETGIPEAHKQAILEAREDATRVTRAFSGRHARGIVNRFMDEVEEGGAILPFPLQNNLTRALRGAAGKAGRKEFLSLWAGQGVRLARRQGAAALIGRLAEEMNAAAGRLKG